jgi:dCMP deaminase
MKNEYLEWEDYFMNLAEQISVRSTCLRKQVGCVITRDNYLISTGYNGALPKHPECLDLGCLRDELNIKSGTQKHICRSMHAEQNAVASAARNGISLKGATCYVTLYPCVNCAKILIMAGIKKIVVKEKGKSQEAQELFRKSEILISVAED